MVEIHIKDGETGAECYGFDQFPSIRARKFKISLFDLPATSQNVPDMIAQQKTKKQRKESNGRVKQSQKPEIAGTDRRSFASGFPMDGEIVAEALARLFARAEVGAKDLAEFRFKPGVHPDWTRTNENREADPACAGAEIEEIMVMILERMKGCP